MHEHVGSFLEKSHSPRPIQFLGQKYLNKYRILRCKSLIENESMMHSSHLLFANDCQTRTLDALSWYVREIHPFSIVCALLRRATKDNLNCFFCDVASYLHAQRDRKCPSQAGTTKHLTSVVEVGAGRHSALDAATVDTVHLKGTGSCLVALWISTVHGMGKPECSRCSLKGGTKVGIRTEVSAKTLSNL